jgi:hypothetical protein
VRLETIFPSVPTGCVLPTVMCPCRKPLQTHAHTKFTPGEHLRPVITTGYCSVAVAVFVVVVVVVVFAVTQFLKMNCFTG